MALNLLRDGTLLLEFPLKLPGFEIQTDEFIVFFPINLFELFVFCCQLLDLFLEAVNLLSVLSRVCNLLGCLIELLNMLFLLFVYLLLDLELDPQLFDLLLFLLDYVLQIDDLRD